MPNHQTINTNLGFSMMELVMVIMIMSIIASVGVTKFSSIDVFEARGFADETLSAIRYAQKRAIHSHCDIAVTVDATGYRVSQWAVCQPLNHNGATTPLLKLGRSDSSRTENQLTGTPKSSIVINTNTSFYFDYSGLPQPIAAAALSDVIKINISTFKLCIELRTGYAHASTNCT